MLLQYRSVCVWSFRIQLNGLDQKRSKDPSPIVFVKCLSDKSRGTLLSPRLQSSVNVAPVCAPSSPDGKPMGGCSTRRRAYPTSNRAALRRTARSTRRPLSSHSHAHLADVLSAARPCRDGVVHAKMRNLRNTDHRTLTRQRCKIPVRM